MPTLVIYALVAISLFGAGAASGVKLTSDHYKAAALDSEKKAEAAVMAEAQRANVLATQLEQKKETIRVVTQTITKTVDRIVDRPVYRNVCLDDDGLRLANDALQAISPAAAGPDGAVPAAVAPGGRDGSGGVAKAGGS